MYRGAQKVGRVLSLMRWTFVLSFAFVFFMSAALLSLVGLVPEIDTVQTERVNAAEMSQAEETASPASLKAGEDMVPARVIIPSVGIDVPILTPPSRDIAVLDEALLKGAVHYPGSGLLNEHTNMFLFGHSSYLPVVHNGNFKAFNNLQKVRTGDFVFVDSSDTRNVYRVDTVELVDASKALVELSMREKKLTLSTCNSFGDPGERYMVEARFVESRAL